MESMQEEIKRLLLKILNFNLGKNFCGFDPYDGIFCDLGCKILRQISQQTIKLSPLNFRKALLIKEKLHPKTLALFSMGLSNLYEVLKEEKCLELAENLLIKLKDLKSKYFPEYCWGHTFAWQTREKLIPENYPTAVNTAICASAFLDFYKHKRKKDFIEIAKSAGDFLMKRLNIKEDRFYLSYTPIDRNFVHNANSLSAGFLCKLFHYTGEQEYLNFAEKVFDTLIFYQNSDGGWNYGLAPYQRWIDGFHTGFTLWGLKWALEYGGTAKYQENLSRGYIFYREKLFDADFPKYYLHKFYPIDSHNLAVAIIILCEFREIKTALDIARWVIDNFYCSSGYFHFRDYGFYRIKIHYPRWSDAWLFYSFSLLLKEII